MLVVGLVRGRLRVDRVVGGEEVIVCEEGQGFASVHGLLTMEHTVRVLSVVSSMVWAHLAT